MESCGAAAAVILSALSALTAWKWRASRASGMAPLGGQFDAIDGMLGSRTLTGSRTMDMLSGPRGSLLAQRRSVLHQISASNSRTLPVLHQLSSNSKASVLHQMSQNSKSSRQSFHSCISMDSEVLSTKDLDEVIQFNEEAKREREADLGKIEELRSRFGEAEEQDPRTARWLEDNDLMRYVRARPTLDESEVLLRKAMAWRCEQEKAWGDLVKGSWGYKYELHQAKIDDAPDWWAFLYEHLHCTIYGEDSFDIPITYVHMGNQDLSGVVREVGADAMVQFIVYFTDHFMDVARDRYQEALVDDADALFKHGGIVILDMEGLSWSHKGDIGEFAKPGNISKFLHCERQRRSFIVRAPRIFSLCWKIVSPMIDARARDKMQIIAMGDSIQPLVDEIGVDHVPTCIGGTMPDLMLDRPKRPIPQGAFEQFKKERELRCSDRKRRAAGEAAPGAAE